jgi:hypothetical protein
MDWGWFARNTAVAIGSLFVLVVTVYFAARLLIGVP